MINKLLQYGLTIWAVLTLNFVLPRMIPGNPLAQLDTVEGLPVALSQAQRDQIIAYYGLDQPLHTQYIQYMRGLAHGDMGWSINYNAPVNDVLVGRLKWTLLVVGASTVLYVLLGIVLGGLSAWHHHRTVDKIILIGGSALGALPSFFLGMLLVMLFAVRLRWLPLSGAQSAALLEATGSEHIRDIVRHMVLPVTALVITSVGQVTYLTRNALIQVLGQGYITAARAKGLHERRLLFRHALPNAMLPVVAFVAMRFGFIAMGAVMIETTFAYPGIGMAIVEASTSRDYALLQGTFAVVTLSIIAANIIADLLQHIIDPRLRRPAQ